MQTIAMASCPGSVEARDQIYLEQCPLHLKFSWSQVFLEGKDDQRTISLHSCAQNSNFEASMVYGQSVFCSDDQQKMKPCRTFLATGSVEARAQIYLEQCPLHLKFSWSQVFLEGKDDQRTISLTFLHKIATLRLRWSMDSRYSVQTISKR